MNTPPEDRQQLVAHEQLVALATHLHHRRGAILEAWRASVDRDPDLTTGATLSRTLFNDHIPEILDSFNHRLLAWPAGLNAQSQQQEEHGLSAHGLHRWQQGFRLRELTREWGYLHLCLIDEVQGYAGANPELGPLELATALRTLTHLCIAGVSDSTEQYWQLQQAQAAGHIRDLEHALSALNEIENARAQGWREAAHDLRGSLSVVALASNILTEEEVEKSARLQSASILQKSVSSLHEMLTNLIDLARLEAGQERRTITRFDAAVLVCDFCQTAQPIADQHGLFLKAAGPDSLRIEGDRTNIRRVLQNLVLNALKYTQQGGVVVSWESSQESEAQHWMLSVQDTGPGFEADPGVPMVNRLREATQGAHDMENQAAISGTSSSHDEPAPTLTSQSLGRELRQQTGEGIGLSIVKGLCDLLDATLEIETSPGQGSTFRVTFPAHYGS